MASAVKADTSKRLGSLLLKGWAMLAENCQQCQVPLMKERGSDERLCVNCDTTYVLDGQGLRPTKREEAQPPPEPQPQSQIERQPQPTSSADGHDSASSRDDGEYDDVPYDPLADPRLGPFAAASRGASGTATTRSSADVQTGAAAAGAAGSAAKDAAAADPGFPAAARPAPMPTPASAPSPGGCASDNVADLLSEKMLQGWALLDKYCPRCSTVLVRSKATKRMFCVACDAWVVSEADGGAQPPQPTQPPQPPPSGPRHLEGPGAERRGAAAAAPAAVAAAVPSASTSSGQGVGAIGSPRGCNQPGPDGAPLQPKQLLRESPPHRPPPQESEAGSSAAAAAVFPAGSGALADNGGEQVQVLGSSPVAGGPPFLNDSQQLQQHWLPLTFQQFFMMAGSGGGASRGSSPTHPWQGGSLAASADAAAALGAVPLLHQHQPQQQCQQPQPQQQQQRQGRRVSSGAAAGCSPNGAGKQASGTALLLSIGRTVALKMAEAQGLLERTPAVDTEKARSYVSLISECLDLLSKLHSLQQ